MTADLRRQTATIIGIEYVASVLPVVEIGMNDRRGITLKREATKNIAI